MRKKICIVGLGIGSMYQRILSPYYDVITVDIDQRKNPNYQSIKDCFLFNSHFDLAIIATPNYLHEEQTRQFLNHNTDFILVEKPGFFDYKTYRDLYAYKQNVFITKNNIYREEFDLIKREMKRASYNNLLDRVEVAWINKSRVPFPGSWFTTKDKAWGGTSRDSFPHLLSEVWYLFSDNITDRIYDFDFEKKQNFKLEEVLDTDYGTPTLNGTFDVDDYCKLDFKEIPVTVIGCWKVPDESVKPRIGITLKFKRELPDKYYDFDLCPEYCYLKQFKEFLDLSVERRVEHHKIDLFIHQVLEKL